MMILNINKVLGWVQITAGGRRYTCQLKNIDGELFFFFKKNWHKVADYVSKYTTEFVCK